MSGLMQATYKHGWRVMTKGVRTTCTSSQYLALKYEAMPTKALELAIPWTVKSFGKFLRQNVSN